MWASRALVGVGWAIVLTCVLAITDTIPDQEVSVTVDGVEGESASVPCDLFPTDPKDKVNLILWYKDEAKDPIYSYDARRAVFPSERHHLKDIGLKGRIVFTPSPGEPIPHTLTISRLSGSDAGRYACRVDFMRAQSTTKAARLRVVAPVDSLSITDSDSHPVPPVLSPIPEGGTLNITCTARGGRPQPKVSWWFGEAVIDDSWLAMGSGVVSNNLVLNPLTRAHAHSVLTCKASTAPVAVTTTTVTIDMHLRPLSAEITGAAVSGSVRAGDMLDLTCTARGSRPHPIISWYKGATLLRTENTDRKDVTSMGGVSHVRVAVQRRDNGARITCRVTNPALPLHTLQDHIVINVTYAPEVELRMGKPLEGTVVREDTNLYLTCHVDANPLPHTLVFMHQGIEVHQDKMARVLVNGNNLVLNRVRRTQAGEYSCKATNSEGTGTSPPVNITVLYAPVCALAKEVWAEPGATVTAQCRVHASPIKPIHFSWVWETNSYSRRVIPSHVNSIGAFSSVNFTVPRDNVTEVGPNNQLGALQCWAENTVGRQDKPCIVAVKKPAPPSAPINCSLSGQGREVVTVSCQSGDPPSMPQTYRLQIYEAHTRKLYHNVSSPVPRFLVRGLTSGQDYVVYVSSHTSYGRSPYRLVEAFTFKTAENRMRSTSSPPSLSTIIMFVCGVGAIVIIVIIVVTVVRLRLRKSSHKCVRRTATATVSELPKDILSGDQKQSPDGKEGPASGNHLSKSSQLTVKDAAHTKESIPLQPIIRQSSRPLQPIIKENGRSDNGGKSSQGRTVLFVEPPKPQGGILVNKNEVPRTTYDSMYQSRRGPMKGPNGDVVSHNLYLPRGSYSDSLHTLHVGRGVDGLGGYSDRDLSMVRDREPPSILRDPPSILRDRDPPPSILRDRDPPPSILRDRDPPPSILRDRDPPPSILRDRDPPPSILRDRDPPPSILRDRDPPPSILRDRDLPPSILRDREPPLGRYRASLDDRGDTGELLDPQFSSSASSTLGREPYGSPRSAIRSGGVALVTSPPFTRELGRDMSRDLPRDLGRDLPRDLGRDLPRDLGRDLPRDLGRDLPRDLGRDLPRDLGRDLPRDLGRDHPRERDHPRDREHPRERDHPKDRDHQRERDLGRDPSGHIFTFPTRTVSHEYDPLIPRSPPPISCMKKSPSVSASVGRHYDPPPRRSEGSGYRSLPRPSKTRGAEADALLKYRSLDRRFDLPFSGSLPRPEPEVGEETPPQHRRYSGSPRMRFGDEKHFHVYHDKEKKQDGLDDMDESFV